MGQYHRMDRRLPGLVGIGVAIANRLAIGAFFAEHMRIAVPRFQVFDPVFHPVIQRFIGGCHPRE